MIAPRQSQIEASGRFSWLWIVPLLLAAFFSLNVLQNGFGWDDENIVANLETPRSFLSLFFPNPDSPIGKTDGTYYRPLVSISYHLDHILWGKGPFGFHLSVWIAHILNTVLVFFLCQQLVRRQGSASPSTTKFFPIIVSSLFAVHPIHVEAVAWIAGRNDVFCTTFILGSLLSYFETHKRESVKSRKAIIGPRTFYGISMLLFFLALLTKEMAIGLVLIFPLYDALANGSESPSQKKVQKSDERPLRLSTRRIVTRFLVPASLLLIYFGLRIINLTRPFGNRSSPDPETHSEFLEAIGSYGYFLKMMFFPYPFTPFIARVPTSFGMIMLSLMGLTIMGIVMVYAWRNRMVLVGGAIALLNVLLAPAIVVAIYPIAATPMAERYVYGSSVGFLMITAWGLLWFVDRLEKKGWAIPKTEFVVGLLFVTIIVFGPMTWKRNPAWGSPLVFWERAVLGSVDSGFPHRELGNQYARLNRVEEAHQLYEQAMEIDRRVLGLDHPAVAASLLNNGLLYYNQRKIDEAEPLIQKALALFEKKLNPTHMDIAVALDGLGGVYHFKKEYEKAEALFRRSLKIREETLGPRHPGVLASISNVVAVLTAQGKDKEAEPLVRRSLEIRTAMDQLEPSDPTENLLALARKYYQEGQRSKAEPLFQKVLDEYEKRFGVDHSKTAEVLNHLAGVYYSEGRYTKAKPLFEKILSIREKEFGPDHPSVAQSLNNLGILFFSQGEFEKAEGFSERSVRIRETALGEDHPDLATSLNSLAGLYYTQGRSMNRGHYTGGRLR